MNYLLNAILNYLIPFAFLFTKSLIGIDTEFHTDLTVTLTESHSESHSELFIKGFIESFNEVLTELPSSMCFANYYDSY